VDPESIAEHAIPALESGFYENVPIDGNHAVGPDLTSPMPYRFVKVAREDHLTLITIDRADVLNALHPPAHHELATAFDEFASDPAQWIAIITGSGTRAFCAGNDLKHRAAARKTAAAGVGFRRSDHAFSTCTNPLSPP